MLKHTERIKSLFKNGTRIRLIKMLDNEEVAPGTIGTVVHVDDMGTIHMKWDNGRTLGLIDGVDLFEVIDNE